MKKDRLAKVEHVGRHIPEFPGYRAIDHRETDRLLRHDLARRLQGIGDDLADFIAGLPEGGAPRAALSSSLQRLAGIRESLMDEESSAADQTRISAEQEEALLDFDLNLLDKTAALDELVKRLDREGGGPCSQTILTALLEDLGRILEGRRAFFQQEI